MDTRNLNIFIDESGDFGKYNVAAPYYIVAMVMHDQAVDISRNIQELDAHLSSLNHTAHAIHTAPLIRAESIYSNEKREIRKKLFCSLFHFARKIDFHYISICIHKKECSNDTVKMSAKISSAIATELKQHEETLRSFDKIVIYYDNGQTELTKIISSVFHALFARLEIKKISPVEKKLFQVADLICTMELVAQKISAGTSSKSEHDFFGSAHNFKKNFYKYLQKKKL
ncbi:MAG: DUF3800 domain-containing protein [Schwartzia sp.]|nr:DUF3800 domain-containing protein [Schwartzia sp. (in: firmicutes)]